MSSSQFWELSREQDRKGSLSLGPYSLVARDRANRAGNEQDLAGGSEAGPSMRMTGSFREVVIIGGVVSPQKIHGGPTPRGSDVTCGKRVIESEISEGE